LEVVERAVRGYTLDRDTKKVYAWEDKWTHWNLPGFKTKTAHARRWIAWACDKWGVPMPVVTRLGANAKTSWSMGSPEIGHRIELAPHHNNFAVALHEAAHVIDDYVGDDDASHNPRWLGIYLWLLEHSDIYPKGTVTASAKAAGLKWLKVSPTRYKRNRRKKKKARSR
jgi:hypothetical protein